MEKWGIRRAILLTPFALWIAGCASSPSSEPLPQPVSPPIPDDQTPEPSSSSSDSDWPPPTKEGPKIEDYDTIPPYTGSVTEDNFGIYWTIEKVETNLPPREAIEKGWTIKSFALRLIDDTELGRWYARTYGGMFPIEWVAHYFNVDARLLDMLNSDCRCQYNNPGFYFNTFLASEVISVPYP